MANPNNCLGISNPNGETFVDYHTDPVGANNAFSAGITSGFKVRENDPAGMTVLVGGESGVQDSAIVKSTAGIVYPVGNTTGDAIEITVSGAPATNARIDVIVLSVDTTSTTSELNGYDLVSVDIVEGTAASTPTAPTDADITSEIGAGKAFIRLAEIRVESGVVAIVDSDITGDSYAKIGAQNVDFATSSSKFTSNHTSTGNPKTNWKNTASFTVDNTGTYILIATSRVEYYGNTLQNCYMAIFKGSTQVSPDTGFYGGKQGSTLGQFTITALGYAECVAGDTISARIKFSANTGGFANRNSLAAIRIV